MGHEHVVGVALTRCYYCNEPDRLVLNKILRPERARRVEALHDKVIDAEPCPKCKELMKAGVIIVSVREGAEIKPDDPMPNPHRTGGWCVVKDEAMRRWAETWPLTSPIVAHALKRRFIFIEDEAYDMLGLPRGAVEGVPTEYDNREASNDQAAQ